MKNQQQLLDLNEYSNYLAPYKGRRGEYHCPVCQGKLSISRSNGTKFTCWAGCDRPTIRRAIIDLAGETQTHSQEWLDRQAQKQQQQEEVERDRRSALKSETERDREWQKITANSFLTDKHRQDMLDRGSTPEQIELSNARSSAKGRIIPIVTAAGLIVGSQIIKDEGGKGWYGKSGTNQLRETGELPLTVIYPSTPKAGIIAHTESTLDKPHWTAHHLNLVTIGSSNIGSQPNDLKRSIPTIKERMGWDKVVQVLYPDAAAVVNTSVMGNYRNLNNQLKALGYELQVGWWGQIDKSDGDIDEIDLSQTPIQYISFEQFEAIAAEHSGLLNRFFRQFRPKKQRSTYKPQLKPKNDDGAVEYQTPAELNAILQNAIKDGKKVVLDVTHAGGFKSTTAAQIDGLEGVDKYLYINNQHRNPTTAEVEASFVDLPSRHDRLYINPNRTTPSGKPYLQTSQPKGANWEQAAGNCHQAKLHHTLSGKGYDLGGTDNPICRVCPQLNACQNASGAGYGYKHAKRQALQESQRLRLHPHSLPQPINKNMDAGFDYSSALLIFDDEQISIQHSLEATKNDHFVALNKLATEYPELLIPLASLNKRIHDILNGRFKSSYYGLSHQQILDGIDPIDPDVLEQIKAALTPNFADLIQEADGVNTNGMSAAERRAVKSASQMLATNSKRENRERLETLASNWLVRLLEIVVTGEGYVRWDGLKLHVTQPNNYYLNIVNSAKLSLYLDATGNREDLAAALKIDPDDILVIRKSQPEYANLKIVQVVGMGTPRKNRSDEMVGRLDALTAALKDQHPKLGIIDHNRDDGKGLWFADSRGTNRYRDCDALLLVGSPCPNLGAVAADYSILYGRQITPDADDPDYRAYLNRRIASEIVQAIARLRSHLTPNRQQTVYWVADRDDLPLDDVLGHYPYCHYEQMEAIDIAIGAGTPTQQLRYRVSKVLIEQGIATQEQLASLLNISQSRISQLFKQLGGGYL